MALLVLVVHRPRMTVLVTVGVCGVQLNGDGRGLFCAVRQYRSCVGDVDTVHEDQRHQQASEGQHA
nr:hypothetical protein [Serinicoccus chungangensis]